MAERPVYKPHHDGDLLVSTQLVAFTWFAGMAPSQRQKSVQSLHDAAKQSGACKHPLEVSSKSLDELGVKLSAFNLTVLTETHKRAFTVETAFQSSKVFRDGGPYRDLLFGTSLAAKKDPRIKEAGELLAFNFFGTEWSLQPTTAFYDWLYINALLKNPGLAEKLDDYDAFTDIEFNPKKSLNCQAYSVALYQSLSGRGLLRDAAQSQEQFLEILEGRPVHNASENTLFQTKLL